MKQIKSNFFLGKILMRNKNENLFEQKLDLKFIKRKKKKIEKKVTQNLHIKFKEEMFYI